MGRKNSIIASTRKLLSSSDIILVYTKTRFCRLILHVRDHTKDEKAAEALFRREKTEERSNFACQKASCYISYRYFLMQTSRQLFTDYHSDSDMSGLHQVLILAISYSADSNGGNSMLFWMKAQSALSCCCMHALFRPSINQRGSWSKLARDPYFSKPLLQTML